MSTRDPTQLPRDLPVPIDDGAAAHLAGAALPPVRLMCTSGATVELARLMDFLGGRTLRGVVIFFYPRTGVPGQPPNKGFRGEAWEEIPGARGCTPQSCGFRDLHAEFAARGVAVLGVSTNTANHQREFKARLNVPFEFLSDSDLQLTRAMNLPTFEFPVESGGPSTLIRRMAWFVEPDETGTARIAKVWYPVFPPDQNAASVLAWLANYDRS